VTLEELDVGSELLILVERAVAFKRLASRVAQAVLRASGTAQA
jgi:hypothetical protein